jgi:hypothetical protein
MRNLLQVLAILAITFTITNPSIYSQSINSLPTATIETTNNESESIWKWVTDNQYMSFYYNTQTLEASEDEVIRMQVKSTLLDATPEGRNKLVSMLKDRGDKASELYANFDHAIFYYEFRCDVSQFRQVRATNYSLSGEVLYDRLFEDTEWTDVPSESLAEKLLNAACAN